MNLYKGRWYVITRYSTPGAATVGKLIGTRNGMAAVYGHAGGDLVRSVHTVSLDNFVSETSDPRLIMITARWLGRNVFNLEYL